VLRRLRADFAAEARFDLGDDPHLDNITADTAWQRAQESSDLGDYRQAVRYLYLSTLLLLEERDLLRYDRTLTNREYLSRLAHRPDLAAILRDVVDVFDRVWYGYQPLSEGEYGRFADRVQTLKQQKGGGHEETLRDQWLAVALFGVMLALILSPSGKSSVSGAAAADQLFQPAGWRPRPLSLAGCAGLYARQPQRPALRHPRRGRHGAAAGAAAAAPGSGTAPAGKLGRGGGHFADLAGRTWRHTAGDGLF
jgi:hypothetical protein